MNQVKKIFSHDRSSQDMADIIDKTPVVDQKTSARNTSAETGGLAATENKLIGNNKNATTSVSPSQKTQDLRASVSSGSTTSNTKTNGMLPPSPTKTTASGRSQEVAALDGSNRHSIGHSGHTDLSDLSKEGKVEQTVHHLGHVTNETKHRHEIEEVTRDRTVHAHKHHIQVHHQPIASEEHSKEQMHTKMHPETQIQEKHASTDRDAQLLSSVQGNFKDSVTTSPTDRKIIDKGENVNEIVHHHIHNVVQPIVNHESHDYHRIKTTIPTTHIQHHAPIIHEATTHEAITKADFLKGGGILGAKSNDASHLLHTGTCERKVNGIGERLERELGLGGRNSPVPPV